MRVTRVVSGIAATAMAVLGSVGVAPSAHAEDWGVDITGTWSVYSDGAWARTNGVKIKEQSVLETWTVNTKCVSPIECFGEVKSSLGWTGTARLDAYWFVEHVVPNWMPCPNGTFATGYQKFILVGWDPVTARSKTRDITTFNGRNITKSDSGACGVNLAKVIELPVRMDKIS
ncbi:hypothetical protein [Mycolicibacterium parafortuitum]|uniref:Secreted protein n=1 Tax=Mycolicibacterium parafortuitum TaxID=39692 RepID=A0A375YPY6_MYCPF|nr:hypothetical protein [Mycolicibacterium parafortuitum]ORB29673.1 hypothetical protein BST38_14105 [Mycolicibacterium parafortuitum]SRX83143.1 hypothetical protein MPP7335_04917 [Mycolicibacterium parafortuitum]